MLNTLMQVRALSVAVLATSVALGLQPPSDVFRFRRKDDKNRLPSPFVFLVPMGMAPLELARRKRNERLLRVVEKDDLPVDLDHGTDFSGRWRLIRSDNFDAYLQALNVSATHRHFATRATVEQTIRRRPEGATTVFEVCVLNRLGEKCEVFVVGAGPIESTDPRGDPIIKHVSWEDPTKRVLVTCVDSVAGRLIDKRTLVHKDEMVMELISPDSRVRAFRVFSRIQEEDKTGA